MFFLELMFFLEFSIIFLISLHVKCHLLLFPNHLYYSKFLKIINYLAKLAVFIICWTYTIYRLSLVFMPGFWCSCFIKWYKSSILSLVIAPVNLLNHSCAYLKFKRFDIFQQNQLFQVSKYLKFGFLCFYWL